MGCIALVRCVLVLRCGLAVVVWYPYAGFSLHTDTTLAMPVPHHVAYDAHLASGTPNSIFLHNMTCFHNTLFKNELDSECYNITLAGKNIAP